MHNWLMMRTMGAGRLRVALALAAAGALLSGCGTMSGASSSSSPSIGDRFGQLFGSKSQAVGEAAPPPVDNELSCPPVSIRAGASTFAVGAPGKQAVGNDLRYQATITRTARDCTQNGDQITARIGILGRVIAGPAGNPPSVEIPLRVAVVQGGVQEKTIATKVYRTTVTLGDSTSVPFSLVAEDMVYPVPPGATGDSYIFYIGFDPQALTPEPAPKAPKKKKKQAAAPPE
jgi:predicted small secreted protein